MSIEQYWIAEHGDNSQGAGARHIRGRVGRVARVQSTSKVSPNTSYTGCSMGFIASIIYSSLPGCYNFFLNEEFRNME